MYKKAGVMPTKKRSLNRKRLYASCACGPNFLLTILLNL
jgi:hypothetical protein